MISLFDKGAHPPCPSPFNLAQYVLHHARDLPNKPALVVMGTDKSTTWTFAELETAVRATATGLIQRGATPGARILMRLGNDVEFPIAYLAAITAGCVPVPTSSQLNSADVDRMIADLAPQFVLQDPQISAATTPIATISLDELHSMRGLPMADYHLGAPDREAYIIYTSGTSGSPRAVAHAHRAIWARQMMHEGWYGLRTSDRMMHAGAFNWTFTLGTGLMDPWSVGATSLIPAPDMAPSDLPHLMRDHEASIFAAVPGVYRKILMHHTKIDLPHLRHGLAAGEKLSQNIRDAWQASTNTEIFEAFGMSECSTFISSNANAPAHAKSLGKPQLGRRIALLKEGKPVTIGETGIIAISNRDPGLMLGYANAPGEMAERSSDEWFLTGDLGVMDEEYHITYVGRADDMMNAGGYRVSPIEVESALASFDGLTQVGVTDVEIKEDVRIIVAFYVAETHLDPDALAAFAEKRLARYKQPRAYVRLAQMPTNANGKLLRAALRAHYPEKDRK